jgi:hypothetical protein
MADFTVRVELLGDPSYTQYEKLHALMSGLGFGRTIDGVTSANERKTFNLPHATYYGTSASTCASLRDILRSKIRTEIQAGVIIFVAETSTWALG